MAERWWDEAWPSNGNPGVEFDFVDPHGLDDTAAVVF
jgi:hypothetical protein